ncbi:MAG: protein kinase domain-containing protein [Ktedonobacteraceae bacterium]
MAELTGVTVGNYFLLECLGREGMIESYRARPTTRGGFDVVLRLFRPPFPDPTAFQEHFVSEVEKVWHCHHEHIQPLLEYGSGDELLFDVTEFPKDKTLEHILECGEDGELFRSLHEIVHLITQICDALQYIHNQHIVHGNIQPSSFLIQSDHTVLLTNFSMKHIYQENEPLVAQIEEGNAAYVAPEQVVGMITPASDIYAVGVLLYRMLTGHLPYDGESAGEIALKHTNEAIPSLRQFRPDVSEAVELVMRVALAKSPEARFPSADALAKALLSAIVTDRPPIVTAKAQQRIEVHSKRRTALTWSRALSLIAVLLVLSGLVGTLNFFSTLPQYLEAIPGVPFHANIEGSVVETKLSRPSPASAPNNVSTSTPTPNGITATPQVHLTPTVKRTSVPIVSGTVIPIIPLTHNNFCASSALKLDTSPNLLPLLQQVDVDYLNACHKLTISLHGDGSQTSLNKLEHNRIDVAGSDLTANPGRTLTDQAIGAMLYALIVSPDVGINGLSKAEIQDIFNGHISNWAQVGGSNEAITVVLPPAGASINTIFQSFVLNDVTEDVDAMRIGKDSPKLVAQSVLQTSGALSFVPLVVAQQYNMNILAIDGVAPSVQTLLDGTYTFWSVEHFYTQNNGSAAVQAYERLLNSAQEQQVLIEFGIVPMNMIDQKVVDSHGSGPEI